MYYLNICFLVSRVTDRKISLSDAQNITHAFTHLRKGGTPKDDHGRGQGIVRTSRGPGPSRGTDSHYRHFIRGYCLAMLQIVWEIITGIR